MSQTNIFKSYDVRGIFPSELNEDVAYKIGRCLAPQLNAREIAIGRDMRASGIVLLEALARGIMEAGTDVVDVGLVSTDALYFAVGKYQYGGGVMITASHNPAEYNGMKFTASDARAISFDTGLNEICKRIGSGDLPPVSSTPGKVTHRDVLSDFAEHCLSFVDLDQMRPLKIAIDAGNGMGGEIVKRVFQKLPFTVLPLFFEPDGTFPNHPANPLEPENMRDLCDCVVKERCDLGVAFDGDADRMFLVDEQGKLIGGDIVTALVAINTLKRHPGSKILYNVICSRGVPESIKQHGGIPRRSPVGHSLIKKLMRDEDIIFGGEHSGHFYFKDNWYADSGMIALLQCLEVFSAEAQPVSNVIAPLDSRFRSGEINSKVSDIPARLLAIEKSYSDGLIDRLDGLTIEYPDWWMNVRASNTEPLLRLNVEADTAAKMQEQTDRVLEIIRQGK